MQIITWYKNRRWNKPQTHDLRYEVKAPAVRKGVWLLLPYPVNTEYQQVKDVRLNAVGEYIQHDYFFAIRNCSEATVRCTVNVQPRKLDTKKLTALTLHDYIKKSDGEFYCQPDAAIQSDHPRIQQLAAEYRKKDTMVLALIRKLFDHTVATLCYGDPMAGLYTPQQALELPQVDCGGFSTYLAALCRACQIPTRLISGFWAGHQVNEMHAWIECLLPNGQWLALDPSVEYLRKQGRTNKLGGFNEIGSDRIVMNTGSHHTVRLGSQTITMDIIQTPTFIATNGDFEYIKNYKILTQ